MSRLITRVAPTVLFEKSKQTLFPQRVPRLAITYITASCWQVFAFAIVVKETKKRVPATGVRIPRISEQGGQALFVRAGFGA
jgi:hypothetical protein